MDWGDDPVDATPLTLEQRAGLKLAWVTTRAELDDVETDNVLAGMEKWQRRKPALETLLDDKFVRDLHRDMFGEVWAWAGSYRIEQTNIGLESWKIAVAVRDLVADAAYWFAAATSTTVDAIAARFHHRLVQIHPFPNGNGRHARELTDLIMLSVEAEQFTWGSDRLRPISETRRAYMRALQAADLGSYTELLSFVRS